MCLPCFLCAGVLQVYVTIYAEGPTRIVCFAEEKTNMYMVRLPRRVNVWRHPRCMSASATSLGASFSLRG
jgi:hypothetical protein